MLWLVKEGAKPKKMSSGLQTGGQKIALGVEGAVQEERSGWGIPPLLAHVCLR